MVTHLLDGNVLIALVVDDHVHHSAVTAWFPAAGQFATCPITQGTLLRALIRGGMEGTAAAGVLAAVTRHRDHQFWPDDQEYGSVNLGRVGGHRQVTDAYLAQLARSRSARLATLDRAMADVHHDVADLVGFVDPAPGTN